MRISGYAIHEDEDYAVLGSWLFKVTAGRLGKLKVVCKHTQIATSATRGERLFLTAVLGHLAQSGHPLGPTEATASLFRQFAEALCARGGWNHGAFFQQSPDEIARDLTE